MRKVREQGFDRGAVSFEMAISISLIVLLCMVTIDVLRISHLATTVQYVAARGMRQAVIGPIPDPNNPNQPMPTQSAWNGQVRTRIMTEASRLSLPAPVVMIQSGDNQDDFDPGCTIPSGYQENAGEAGKLFSVRICYAFYFSLWPFFPVNVQADAIGRNEPFGKFSL